MPEWGLAPYPTPTAARAQAAVIALLNRLFPAVPAKNGRNEPAYPLFSKAYSVPMFSVVLDEAEPFEFVTADLMLVKYPLWVVYLVSDAAQANVLQAIQDVQAKRQAVRTALVLPLQGLDELNDVTPGAKTPFKAVAGDGATVASVLTFTLECREQPR